MVTEVKVELFVGMTITTPLQRQLDESKDRYGYLLEGGDAENLQRVTIDGKEVLGRPVEQGTTVDSLGDIVRNLKSILLKMCPGYALKDSEIKMYTRTVRS